MAQQNLRARQQQRQRFIIILIILALLGAGAFFFLNSKNVAKKSAKPRPKGHVAVPIAKKDIPVGTRISNKLFTVKFLKPNDVPTDAILSVDEFLGRFSTRPLLEGQYFKQGDVGGEGAAGGFSAMAKPGKRLITLPANLFPGSLETLKVGDRVDLLAFEGTSLGISAGRKSKNLSDSATTLQGGGAQPGDPNSKARQRARARAGNNATAANATNATLIAENAEVMSVPPAKNKKKRRAAGGDFLVLQMSPQDAHVTTLMAATSTLMRTVFRPFSDETRLTQEEPAKITTRFPRASADPDAIMIISGGSTYMQRPNSKMFVDHDKDSVSNAKDEADVVIKKNPSQVKAEDNPLKLDDDSEQIVDETSEEPIVKKKTKAVAKAQEQLYDPEFDDVIY